MVYSATFLWLGWRKFALLELGDVSFGEGAPLSEALAGEKWWLGWLRCRPTGSLRNLMRKELRLLKPVFLIAAMFSGCWLVTLALLFLQPARKETFEAVFNVLSAIYMPLLAVLAGCVSLGEEKTLGLTAWHLTLPVSARRQWLVKLSIAAAAGAALGLVLPWFLAWMTVAKVEVGLIYLMHDQGDGVQMLLNGVLLLLVSELMFVMSFWAATLLANTVRAALTGVISLAGLGGCAALGAWCALQLGGLEKPLLLLVTAHFQLPPDFFWQLFLLPFLFLCLVTSISLTALAQSLVQFRRAQAQTGALLKYLAILAATAFVLSFWCSDFEVSGHGSYNAQLEADLSNALRALPSKELDFSSRRSRVVTLRELEQTGKLSHPTRAWLRNTSITYRPSGTQFIPAPERKVYEASIMFPNGRSCVLAYTEQGSLGWGAPELSSKPNHHN